MGAAYAKAAFPEPYRVLGLPLKPFCLGHYFILSKMENAFVADEATAPTVGDLVVAVLVCSMTPDEFIAMANPKPPPATLWGWLCWLWWKIFGWLGLPQTQWEREVRRWGKVVGLFNLEEKTTLFQKYLAEAQQCPKFWEEKEESPRSGMHWSHALLATLVRCGFSRETVLNEPLSQALHDFYAHAESLGEVRFMLPEEVALTEENARP